MDEYKKDFNLFDPNYPLIAEDEDNNELENPYNFLTYTDPEMEATDPVEDFYTNLAEILPSRVLASIAENLLEAIDEDLDSRQEWENSMKEGIEQLGLKVERQSFPFDNASGNFSTAYTEAILSFSSTARAELLPAQGPLKTNVLGQDNPEVLDQAERVGKFMNYYLTNVAKEFYPEMEKVFLWDAIVGSVFVKVYQHPVYNRPTIDRIMPQDFVVSQNAKSLETASRIVQILRLNKKELRQRQINGLYRDIPLYPNDDMDMEGSDIQETIDNIQGTSHENLEYNDEYVFYECHADLDIEGFEHLDEMGKKTGIPLPYIVTIDKQSRNIMSIYRNWDLNDFSYKRIDYFVKFTYLPGLDFWDWGIAHIAGGSAKAATTLLRQMMDAATLSNFPGGLRIKGMRLQDNNIRIGPMEFAEIETGGMPIGQAIQTMPYKEPSQVMYQLKQDMENNILKLASVVNMKFEDLNVNAPVGTTMAFLEQSSRGQSAIIQRFHRSMGDIFKIMFRLFKEYLPEEPYPYKIAGGAEYIMRNDFSDQIDIIPVSDPSLNSSLQRLMRAESILKLAQQAPELHDMREIYFQIYREMKIFDIDKILPNKKEQKILPLDPITENMNLMQKKPVTAGLEQDHTAHMITHSQLLSDPTQQEIAPAIQAHIQEHMAMKYMLDMQQRMGIQFPENVSELPMDMQNQIAELAAQASQKMEMERKQAEQQQQNQQPDPTQLMIEDMKQRADYNQKKLELELEKIKLKSEDDIRKADLKIAELQQKSEFEKMHNALEEKKADLNFLIKTKNNDDVL